MPGQIEVPPEDADEEMLRAIVFEYAQKERPPPGGIKPWKEGEQLRTQKPAASKPKKEEAGMPKKEDLKSMPAMLFKKLDLDRNKKLSREEMGPMIEQINAAAVAKGEAAVDFFSQLDVNKDGAVELSEAEAFFERVMGGSATGGSVAAGGAGAKSGGGKPEGEPGDMASMMFRSLDKDADRKLSPAEMADVLQKTAEAAKQNGETEYIDFESLDTDKDGMIDMQEAARFIEAIYAGLKQPAPKEEL